LKFEAKGTSAIISGSAGTSTYLSSLINNPLHDVYAISTNRIINIGGTQACPIFSLSKDGNLIIQGDGLYAFNGGCVSYTFIYFS
jgi:G3E family GTPase